ncbi:hypothetical protein PRIC2_002852 [Phytophthora ramorum]
MSPRLAVFAFFSMVVMIACSVQYAVAMEGELRLYKEPEFRRLRRLMRVSTSNLCYDMPCAYLNTIISSARWSGLPTTGATFADGQIKIAFYAGSNCTGKVVAVNTNVGQVDNFAKFGMDNATASFAVLETSTTMQHESSNICE